MFKGKIFEYLKKYFDEYLFGFDKRQLDVGLLSGNASVKHVNLRPDKANELISRSPIPFSLKAGMLGKLSLKPIEVTVEDLCLILGPRQSQVSHDESYHEVGSQEDTDDEYDEENAFNIFEHQLQVRLTERQRKRKLRRKKRPESEDDRLSSEDKVWRNLKLSVNRVHIRYEDDYFAGSTPYSWGLICDSLSMMTTDSIWKFPSLESIKFKRETPHVPRDTILIIKELMVKGAKLYWNSMGEMFIPSSLWEQTKHLEYQIFDAMPADVLYELMMDFFKPPAQRQQQQDLLLQPLDAYLSIQQWEHAADKKSIKLSALCRPAQLNIKPQTIKDLQHFQWYLENLTLLPHLKIYRPYRRPIIGQQPLPSEDNVRSYHGEAYKRKRRLIVRDWFFLVVWYVRIRKGFHRITSRLQDKAKLASKFENRVSAALAAGLPRGGLDFQICNWVNHFVNFAQSAQSEKEREDQLTGSERDLLEKSKRRETQDILYYVEPKLSLDYTVKLEKLTVRLHASNSALHKAAFKATGMAMEVHVEDSMVNVKALASSAKACLVTQAPRVVSPAVTYNTPVRGTVLETTPSSHRAAHSGQATRTGAFGKLYEGTRNFIANRFTSNPLGAPRAMSKASSPKRPGNPLAGEVIMPPRPNPTSAKSQSGSFFALPEPKASRIDIFAQGAPSRRPGSGAPPPTQPHMFSPEAPSGTPRANSVLDHASEPLGGMLERCILLVDQGPRGAIYYANQSVLDAQRIGLDADLDIGFLHLEYAPDYIKTILELCVDYELVLPLDEALRGEEPGRFQILKPMTSHVLSAGVFKQFITIPLVLLSRVLFPEKPTSAQNSALPRKRRVGDNDGTKETSEDESEASVGNEGGISEKFRGFMRNNSRKFKFPDKPPPSVPPPHPQHRSRSSEFDLDDEVGEEVATKPPAQTFISATNSHPPPAPQSSNYEIQLPAVGGSTRRAHFSARSAPPAQPKIEQVVKNFDELMGAVGVGVRVCLRGASVVDRSNTGFSLTLPAMPLGVEKSKESVLVSVLGMEMRVPASVARNLAELSGVQRQLDFYLSHPLLRQVRANFEERRRVTLHRTMRKYGVGGVRQGLEFEVESQLGGQTQQQVQPRAAMKVGGAGGGQDSSADEIIIQPDDWAETPREEMEDLRNRQRFNFEHIMAQRPPSPP